MKVFAQVWLEDDNGENGRYECREHEIESCPICTDPYFEKPISLSKLQADSITLDEAMKKIIGNKNERNN